MATKAGKYVGAKAAKKTKKSKSNYEQDIRECFKKGYAQLSDKNDEAQRLQVRENCRNNPRSSNKK